MRFTILTHTFPAGNSPNRGVKITLTCVAFIKHLNNRYINSSQHSMVPFQKAGAVINSFSHQSSLPIVSLVNPYGNELLFEIICYDVLHSLADPGGAAGAPPNRIHFFYFHIRFCQKVYMSEVGAPPMGRRPPPTGNPGSATGTIHWILKKLFSGVLYISLQQKWSSISGIMMKVLTGSHGRSRVLSEWKGQRSNKYLVT